MKRLSFFFTIVLISSFGIVLSSCTKTEEITIISSNAGGSFVVENLSTKETLQLDGGIIISPEGPVLNVKNNDKVKISFTPSNEYKDYTFEITYTLHNGKSIKNQQSYEFEISDTKSGNYDISLYAKTTEQAIYASRGFVLSVTE